MMKLMFAVIFFSCYHLLFVNLENMIKPLLLPYLLSFFFFHNFFQFIIRGKTTKTKGTSICLLFDNKAQGSGVVLGHFAPHC